MTDVFPPDDEMISSYLDGEATPDEIARIEASPQLSARASDLRAAIVFAAAPVDSLDVGIVDDMLAAALDAGDLPDNVTDLAAARPRALPKVLLAAAAVVLVALAIPALRLMSGSSGSFNSASAPTAVADSTGDAVAESLGANKALAPSATTTAAATTAAPSLDFAPADMADPTGAAESGIAPPAARSLIPGLPPLDPATFDPLPDALAPVPDLAALEIVLNGAFTGQTIPAPSVSADSGVAGFDPTVCTGPIADFLASNAISAELAAPTAVADFAQVRVGGVDHWLSLVRLSPTRAVALVVDSTTCTPITLIDVAR